MRSIQFLLLMAIMLEFSCLRQESSVKDDSSVADSVNQTIMVSTPVLSTVSGKLVFTCNELITIDLKMGSNGEAPDSVQVSVDDRSLGTFSGPGQIQVDTRGFNPGRHRVIARTYSAGKPASGATLEFRLLSDIRPAKYTYQVKKEYPHDTNAYTQGLEYYEGYLLEGTGNTGQSSLRKTDLKTGEVLKYRSLPAELFGEGITRVGNKIFQVTYKSQMGFVYDVNSFEVLGKIYYQNREGWGLTNNGSEIIMSDGTHTLYFMDTTYFSLIRKLEVYDHEKEVDSLNEMEYIDGNIYANRYLTDEIVIIDAATGKVEGRIDMSGLLKSSLRKSGTDVLNGIAWDKDNNRIFVTGKYWPLLYEVTFRKVN